MTPIRATLLARISDSDDDDTHSTDDQEKALRRKASQLGWGVGRVVTEDNTSAFKRRKITLPNGRTELRTYRPAFRAALEDLAAGRADGLLAVDLDRVCRDPRDLEDLIDVVEGQRVPVESITGSLRLATDADVTMARVMVAVANKSSRDTARRVSDARIRQAQSGRFGGGRRPFGFEPDGVTVREIEAAEVRSATQGVVDGLTLSGLAADLRAREVLTVTGARWTAMALRDIILRPRNAGLMVHRGEVLDVAAPWTPLVPREQWEQARRILTDGARRTSPGNVPKWLGSAIYRCEHPVCLADLAAGTKGKGALRVNGGRRKGGVVTYRCSHGHVSRPAELLDAYVSAHLVARLSRPDAVDLLSVRPDVDLGALAREAASIRSRIKEAHALWEDGTDTPAEYRATKGRLTARLADVEAAQHSASGHDPLAGLAGRPDIASVWVTLPLARQRQVLETLASVTVLAGTKALDATGVRITPTR